MTPAGIDRGTHDHDPAADDTAAPTDHELSGQA